MPLKRVNGRLGVSTEGARGSGITIGQQTINAPNATPGTVSAAINAATLAGQAAALDVVSGRRRQRPAF
jgi:hypothetical protein